MAFRAAVLFIPHVPSAYERVSFSSRPSRSANSTASRPLSCRRKARSSPPNAFHPLPVTFTSSGGGNSGRGGFNRRPSGGNGDDGEGSDDEQFSCSLQGASVLGTALYLVSRRYYSPRNHSPFQRPQRPLTWESFLRDIRVTHILLALNVVVFVVQMLRGPAFMMAGAKVNSAIAAGELHRLFTPMFLHGSTTHLLVNSFSLNSTGTSIESWFGKPRFLALYLLSGLCGNALSYLCTPNPAVGASGAIFGIVGATAVVLSRHRRLLGPRARRSLQSLAYVVILNFGFGLSPGSQVDNFGHLGGLIGGLAYSYLFGPRLVVRRVVNNRAVVADEPLFTLVLRDLQLRMRQIRKALSQR